MSTRDIEFLADIEIAVDPAIADERGTFRCVAGGETGFAQPHLADTGSRFASLEEGKHRLRGCIGIHCAFFAGEERVAARPIWIGAQEGEDFRERRAAASIEQITPLDEAPADGI